MAVAGVFISAMKVFGVLIDGKHRRQVATAAEPALGCHDQAGIHVSPRHQRRTRMNHHRHAGRPELGIFRRPRNLITEFLGKFTANGGHIDAGFFEHPAAHYRHDATAAVLITLTAVPVSTLPGGALEPAGRAHACGVGTKNVVLDSLQRRTQVVPKGLKPKGRPFLVFIASVVVAHGAGNSSV